MEATYLTESVPFKETITHDAGVLNITLEEDHKRMLFKAEYATKQVHYC